MRVAFFTAGTTGAGHLARGIAIGRALGRAGFSGRYRVFAPSSTFAGVAAVGSAMRAFGIEEERVEIDETSLRSSRAAPESGLARSLAAFAPDVLLVDMFWAPLRHVLPVLRVEAWLLLRSFPPTWLAGPEGLPFDAAQFGRILTIEPVSTTAATDTLDPIVLVNPDECRPRGALRERLGVVDGRALVGVMHAGNIGECDVLVPSPSAEVHVARFDLGEAAPLFPVAEWLGDCDRIHAGAGYNAFWEAKWLGYFARTTFTSFRRVNDDQPWRIAKCTSRSMRANGADTLAARLLRG